MPSYDGPGTNNDTTYSYDAWGRRITKDVNGTVTAYFHDILHVVAEYDDNNQHKRGYVTRGLDDNLSVTASGNTYYYLRDALGSVRQLIDSNETTQNSYDYFASGKVFGTPTENVTQPFRFTGRAWDSETSLCYYRARMMVLEYGRFLNRDLWLSPRFPNPYMYVGNTPVYWVDPTGLVWYNPLDWFDPAPRNPRDWSYFDAWGNVVYGGGEVGAAARRGYWGSICDDLHDCMQCATSLATVADINPRTGLDMDALSGAVSTLGKALEAACGECPDEDVVKELTHQALGIVANAALTRTGLPKSNLRTWSNFFVDVTTAAGSGGWRGGGTKVPSELVDLVVDGAMGCWKCFRKKTGI